MTMSFDLMDLRGGNLSNNCNFFYACIQKLVIRSDNNTFLSHVEVGWHDKMRRTINVQVKWSYKSL